MKDKSHLWFIIYLVCIGVIATLLIIFKGDAIQEWMFPHHFTCSMCLLGQITVMAVIVLAVEIAVAFGQKLIYKK